VFGAVRIATIRGIPIRLHITLLAMFFLMMIKWGYAFGLAGGFILFGSVLLHELGHALVAQRYGIRIASIVLHLLGGMALMTRPPEKPRQEVAIAAAGPLVSFLIGGSLFAFGHLVGVHFSEFHFEQPYGFSDLLMFAAYTNLAMGIFNLVPALPMDGGRIFRAALAEWIGSLSATRIAAWVSRAFGVVFIGVGLMAHQFSLVIIGVMLFLMVWNELRVAEAQEAARIRASQLVDLRETREEFIDALGRRYVVVTRMID
jgi:Zn-dependent protease